MPIEFSERHFDAQNVKTTGDHEHDTRARPALVSQSSAKSSLSTPTLALSRPAIDPQTVIDTREGYAPEHGDDFDVASGSSKVPTMRSMTTDLADSLSQVLVEEQEPRSSAGGLPSTSTKSATTSAHSGDELPRGLTAEEVEALSEDDQLQDFLSREKHYFILSAAGKPIYSRYGNEQVVSGYMGIFQAIMGFYQDSSTPDVLQSFFSDEINVVMVVKGPVYLVGVSRLQESENTLRAQLEFLYEVVVSSATSTSMTRLFERGDNFDLGRLLGGTTRFMDNVCDQLTYGSLHLDNLLGSLSILRLRSTLRTRINNIMAHYRPATTSNLLYGMLAVNKKLVSVLHPKGHSLYPSDLRIVFETVWERGMEQGQDYWLPLCLPKFNSTGYLHLFVSFLAPAVAIILLSADKDDFFELQSMKDAVAKKLNKEGLVQDLIKAKHNQVSTNMLGIQNIVQHFIFKSRSHVQHLTPDWNRIDHNCKITPMQLMQMYEKLLSIGSSRHKLQIQHFPLPTMSIPQESQDEDEKFECIGLSWTSPIFELYVISRPSRVHDVQGSNKGQTIKIHELIGAANVIHQFVRREEARVWLEDGVSF